MKALLWTTLLMLNFACLWGQRPVRSFRTFDRTNGLSANAVYCLIQDKRGFLWAGTDNGVYRHDGNSFKAFQPDLRDSLSLDNQRVYSLLEDVHGYIWAITNEANQRFDPEKEIFEPFRDEEWAGFIRRTGLEAWLKPPVWQINGRLGDGLFVEKGLVGLRPVSVLERSNGEIWIASKEGIQVSVTESDTASKCNFSINTLPGRLIPWPL